MHSTIFTRMAMAAMLIGTGTVASAQDISGCWSRTYSDSHLASQPAQVVQRIAIFFSDVQANGERWADMQVATANQGHVAKTGQGGQVFAQGLICFAPAKNGTTTCAVECDGGSAEMFLRADGRLDLVTSYLTVGTTDGCGGIVDIAERPGHAVTYRMSRAPAGECSNF